MIIRGPEYLEIEIMAEGGPTMVGRQEKDCGRRKKSVRGAFVAMIIFSV